MPRQKRGGQTGQLVVRVDGKLLEHLDRYCKRESRSRSEAIRTALWRLVDDEVPEPGTPIRAIKPMYREAVERAFRDEGMLWMGLSTARFSESPEKLAGRSMVHVAVERPAYMGVSLPPGTYAGAIEWEGWVNTPEELYKAIRDRIRSTVDTAHAS